MHVSTSNRASNTSAVYVMAELVRNARLVGLVGAYVCSYCLCLPTMNATDLFPYLEVLS